MGKKRSSRKGAQKPPQILSNNMFRHVYRFSATAAFNGNITDQLLLNVGPSASVTAVLAHPVAQSVRINSVEVWSPSPAQGTTATVSVEWPTSGTNPSKEITDTSNNVAGIAHVKTQPPKMSTVGFWSNGTGNTYFTLVCPVGTIIDLDLSYVLLDGAVSTISQVTVGATVGAIYYGYLDSLTAAGAVLAPVSLVPPP